MTFNGGCNLYKWRKQTLFEWCKYLKKRKRKNSLFSLVKAIQRVNSFLVVLDLFPYANL